VVKPVEQTVGRINKETLMEEHVKVLAILNIVLGGLGVIGALFILLLFGGLAGVVATDHDPDAGVGVAALGVIGTITFLIIFVLSVPCIIGGVGLLKFRPWAQTLTIVMSILNLIHIPIGTALGIYGLWVLLNDQTKSLFRARATA
jgi:hypothetical protein